MTQGEAQRQPLPLPSLRGILSRMRGSEATGPRRCGSSRRRSSRQLRRADQDGTPCPAAGSSPGGPKALIISRNARYMGLSFSPLYGKIYASRHIKRKKRGNCYDRSSERSPQGIQKAVGKGKPGQNKGTARKILGETRSSCPAGRTEHQHEKRITAREAPQTGPREAPYFAF